jgi:hypothetical protein
MLLEKLTKALQKQKYLLHFLLCGSIWLHHRRVSLNLIQLKNTVKVIMCHPLYKLDKKTPAF